MPLPHLVHPHSPILCLELLLAPPRKRGGPRAAAVAQEDLSVCNGIRLVADTACLTSQRPAAGWAQCQLWRCDPTPEWVEWQGSGGCEAGCGVLL